MTTSRKTMLTKLELRAILKKAVFELMDHDVRSTSLDVHHYAVAEETALEEHILRGRHNGMTCYVKILALRGNNKTICAYSVDSALVDMLPETIKLLRKLPKLQDIA